MRQWNVVILVATVACLSACGERSDDGVVRPAAEPPDSQPDIVGFVTQVAPFRPVTEDCVASDTTASPDAPVSSDDQPVCTDSGTPVVGSVLVEEDPASASGNRKISFTVEDGATLLVERDGGYEPVSFTDLAEGQPVTAWSTGEIRESYPEQATALALVIGQT